MNIWDTIFLQPLANGLILFYKFSGNLGIAIILLTVLIRLVLIPLTLPSLRTARKMRDLAPHLERLKHRHKDDRTKLAQAQMELYRQHGVNPASGCLPQIISIVVLIALFQVFYNFLSAEALVTKLNELLWSPLRLSQEATIETRFLYLDLARPDVFQVSGLPFPIPGVFLILSAIIQFLSSKMMVPEVRKEAREAQKTPTAADDIAVSMQRSMLWIFPISTIFIGFAFPSGVVVYWFVFSLFQMIQQYVTSGWGGLAPLMHRLHLAQNG